MGDVMGLKPMLTDKQAKTLKPPDKPCFDGKVTGLLSGADRIDPRNRDQEAPVLRRPLRSSKPPAKSTTNVSPGERVKSMQFTGSAAWKAMSFPGSAIGSSTRLARATCADALRPIWLTKTVTACRTRQRMQPSCSGCGHTVTSRRILSWQSTTPLQNSRPKRHTNRQCRGPWCRNSSRLTLPSTHRVERKARIQVHCFTQLRHATGLDVLPRAGTIKKKIASGVRSMLEWVRRSMARSTMSPTRCRPRAWLIQPAGGQRAR